MIRGAPGRLLPAVAVAVAALTAVQVSLLLPEVPLPLTVPPVLIAAAPFLLSARWHTAAGVAGAALVTASPLVDPQLGLHYFPLAVLLWVVVGAPRRGRIWRFAGAALVALPGVLLVVATAGGTFGVDRLGLLLWGAGPLLLGTLCAYGKKVGLAVTALIGAVVMVLATVDGGFLFAAFWVFGGLWLTVGATGLAAARSAAPVPMLAG